ncbi:unnamed protein product [Eruca vesicaria subsp. sativa]|uniref:NAC domain-containing protein n=1 Tax=Eruca vesicaria subsp. sativa TaxID=29727 RepID=A0ABC8JQJ1_ERUVS|nr:unnamed protein product [Eruca vesicaria subsp. sativa]
METNVVGFRFSPTGEEVINYYLKNKILEKTWLVNEAINEINIYAHDPECLPSLSKLESKDLIWYFFTPREYHVSDKKKGTKRTTPSGFWKATGKDRIIKDRRGHGVEIGIKKTLVYHHGKAANGVGTPWVMHEYHTTSLPLNQRKYVICQVMYKGDSLYGNSSNVLSHSTTVSDLNTTREINTAPEVEQPRQDHLGMSVDEWDNLLNEQDDVSLFNPDTFLNDNYYPYQQPQAPCCEDDYISELLSFKEGNFNDVLADLDVTMMQEHRNDHRPKKPSTGFIVDSSSDRDAESMSATSYQGTSSPDSFHSLSGRFHTNVQEISSLRKDSFTDTQPPADLRTIPSKLEVKEEKCMEKKSSSSLSMVKTEKKGWFITEEAMDRRNRKNPRLIYLMNIIIGFILLMAVIGNIKSVLLSANT